MATQYPEWAKRERAAKDLRKEVKEKLGPEYLYALDNLYLVLRELGADEIARLEFTGDAYGEDRHDSLIVWFDRSDMPAVNYKRVKTLER